MTLKTLSRCEIFKEAIKIYSLNSKVPCTMQVMILSNVGVTDGLKIKFEHKTSWCGKVSDTKAGGANLI